ncbi:protein obstructor-E-like [Centruroides vittatus]|uniref:protein obstructor-E-like n=1 Tax=Centruroides vittatus TaxID=120091 RepID=UPI00350FBED4
MITWIVLFTILTVGWAQQKPKDNICKKEYGLYPHDQYCDYYYECIDGVATLQACPNGLAFSGKGRGLLSNCDYPHRVHCPDNDGRTMGQTPSGSDNCNWLYGVFPHQTSCTRYWQCWNGTATIQQCPFSLLYNDVLHSCDWPDNVPDCQKHPICKDTGNGHVAIEKSCVRFWLCVGGYPRLQRCPAGLAFNPTSARCELADNVPGCEPPPTSPQPDDEEENVAAPPPRSGQQQQQQPQQNQARQAQGTQEQPNFRPQQFRPSGK